jgi:hypothetical protein
MPQETGDLTAVRPCKLRRLFKIAAAPPYGRGSAKPHCRVSVAARGQRGFEEG